MQRKIKVKILLCALFAALIAAPLAAKEKDPRPWDIIQLGIWNGLGANQDSVEVYGVRAGIPVCGGSAREVGAELGIVNAAAARSFRIGLINVIKDGPIPFLPFFNISLFEY